MPHLHLQFFVGLAIGIVVGAIVTFMMFNNGTYYGPRW